MAHVLPDLSPCFDFLVLLEKLFLTLAYKVRGFYVGFSYIFPGLILLLLPLHHEIWLALDDREAYMPWSSFGFSKVQGVD